MMKGQKGYVLILKTLQQGADGERWSFSPWRWIKRWVELYRQRRELASLSDEALKDIGLSRADILQESERPFWDDPLKR